MGKGYKLHLSITFYVGTQPQLMSRSPVGLITESEKSILSALSKQGMGNMRTVRLRPVHMGLGEISAFMLPE